ncbi:ABC transporter permease [candidate division KSB3 bacterium]|uniref:ABC transporter permease n=1 Tax=candidate division KSB3 bacterium TaxID=2044937 RepID=A0A9D5Q8N1_9BACT|nr:ABC transporter permease [candidate division KSB3 bacterium]MBD3327643.1 ABC transporter permease [candidate division KSB3 bacterium]
MKRVAGIAVLLITIMTVSAIIEPTFVNPYNIKNILRWTGLFGLLSLGEAFVIMTGGIDLSVGSIVGFIGAFAANFLMGYQMPIPLALLICLGMVLVMGLIHGLLVTKVGMQPFVVTLCGLFIYRGLIRFAMRDITQGYRNEYLGLKFLTRGRIPSAFWGESEAPKFIADWSLPMPFVILVIVGIILAIFLNRSIYGRYILALGRNEKAARFSGINTDWMTIIAYIISATCAGMAAILFSLDLNTVQPSTAGNMYELYAIAGCVVGGVSLKGGEGNILGVIIGVAIVRVLYNAINILGIATQLEFAVVGLVILIGVGADEMIKNIAAKRRLQEVRGAGTSESPQAG